MEKIFGKKIIDSLCEYWLQISNINEIPNLSQFNPEMVSTYLGNCFIGDVTEEHKIVIRHAGSRLNDIFGQDIKNNFISKMFADISKTYMKDVTKYSISNITPVTFVSRAINGNNDSINMSYLLLPFQNKITVNNIEHTYHHFIGAIIPHELPVWLYSCPIEKQVITISNGSHFSPYQLIKENSENKQKNDFQSYLGSANNKFNNKIKINGEKAGNENSQDSHDTIAKTSYLYLKFTNPASTIKNKNENSNIAHVTPELTLIKGGQNEQPNQQHKTK